MNQGASCAARGNELGMLSSLLCCPKPPFRWAVRPPAKAMHGTDSLLCALACLGMDPLAAGEACPSPGAATLWLPLFPFAGSSLIRFHGSRINGLSLASFDGRHSDKMAPV